VGGVRGRSKPARNSETSGDRLLGVLSLFTVDEPEWTVEAAAKRLRISNPTAYRYFRSLTGVGLISPSSRAGYVLGPAIIEMDREIRICDPMLNAARDVMSDLIQFAAEGSVILLCRIFRDRVICIHQVPGRGPQIPVSYERGRPMPLFRGATSRIVLAFLPPRTLKAIYERQRKEIKSAGLGESWEVFKTNLSMLRRAGVCVTRGEIDPGRVGIAAPVFDENETVLGSLTFVLPARRADETLIGRLVPLTIAGAREIERAMTTRPAAGVRPKISAVK
jgi:DNA-binding IclR family transcriptional regulator